MRRNLRIINELLDGYKGRKVPYEKKDFKTLWVITEIYRQQRQMYEKGSHRIENRIVSLSQPHVRPIIRGKAGSEVEFGAKLSASVIDWYAFLDRISWEAYNESGDLPSQVERYRERFGYYPAVHNTPIKPTKKRVLFFGNLANFWSVFLRLIGRPLAVQLKWGLV